MKIFLSQAISGNNNGHSLARYAENIRNIVIEQKDKGEKYLFVLFDKLFFTTNTGDENQFLYDYFNNDPLLINFGFEDIWNLNQRKINFNKFYKGLKNRENQSIYLDRSLEIDSKTYLVPLENHPDCLGLQILDNQNVRGNNFIYPNDAMYSILCNAENTFKQEENMARMRAAQSQAKNLDKKPKKKVLAASDEMVYDQYLKEPTINDVLKPNPYIKKSHYDERVEEAIRRTRQEMEENKSEFSLKKVFAAYTKKAIKAAENIKNELENIHKNDKQVKNVIILNNVPGSGDNLENAEKQDTMNDSNLGLFVNRFVFPEIESVAAAHPETKYVFVSSSPSKNSYREIYPNVFEFLLTVYNMNQKGQQDISLHTLEV